MSTIQSYILVPCFVSSCILLSQQRSGTEPIPGCIGDPEPGEDYCRYPDTSSPTPAPTPVPTQVVTSAPTPALTVVVTQAPTPEPTQVVTPPPTPEPTQVVTPPPTSMPTPNPSNAPTPPPTTASLQLEVTFSGRGSPPNPLPKCHGDCDNDSQCEGSLVCFQRYVSFEQSTFLHPLFRLLDIHPDNF